MKLLPLLVAVMLLSSGCVSQEYMQKQSQEETEALNRLRAVEEKNTITCENKKACDKAFALTKIYLQEKSDMKIQFSDDTIVTTYNPIKDGYIGLRATKTPGKGEGATIELTASCADKYRSNVKLCALRLADVYAGFQPYIASKLK